MNDGYCPDCKFYGDEMPYGGSCSFLTYEACNQGGNLMQIIVEGKNISTNRPQIIVGSSFGCKNFQHK
ncbi:MAG: hypothetical protein ABF652_05410 [Clostridium beijerinckii]